MVRFFGEYVNERHNSYEELLREQFKRIGQRLWTAIKTLPPQDEEVAKPKVIAKVYGSDPLACRDNERFEILEDHYLGGNEQIWLGWRGRVPDFDASKELPEEEHVR
jgi:hypothetical protein